jgi:glycosyltransferase involved in cell wall biosynthesis
MPNYNHGHLIGRALDAIVAQSRPPDELIIVDDASTDRSLEVIESYAKRYPYIRLVRSEENRGAHESATQAAAMATCDFHHTLSADDQVLPGAFEAAMAMASSHPDVGIVFGAQRLVEGDEVWVQKAHAWPGGRCVSPKEFLHEYLEVEPPYRSLSSATFFRRVAWEKIGFYHLELGSIGDTFAAHALGLMHGAAYVDEPMMILYLDDDSFAGAARQDPQATLDLIARAAWLMRSEPYRAYFPASYVESWERGFREQVVRSARRRIKRELRQRLRDPSGRSDPLPLRLLTDLAIKLISRATARTLKRYPGDLSCYAAEGAPAPASHEGVRAR